MQVDPESQNVAYNRQENELLSLTGRWNEMEKIESDDVDAKC